MIAVSAETFHRVEETYGRFFEPLARVPAEKCARDVLDESKVHDQARVFAEATGMRAEDMFCGRQLLEIGSGFGVFLAVMRRDYGALAVGIEPAAPGFDSSLEIGRRVLREYGLSGEFMADAHGEQLPWSDNSFDYVYSSNVLEHVDDPARVFSEAVRVLKSGGYGQIVFPNYGSLFEGHYALPWIPHQPRFLAEWWVRLWGRSPDFLASLRFLTYRDACAWALDPRVDALDFGKTVFAQRMRGVQFRDWAGLGKITPWLTLASRLGLVGIATRLLTAANAFTPIIFTFRKRY